MRLTRFAQYAIILTPVFIFGWLLWIELVPTGTFSVRHAVNERSPFIDRLLPEERVLPLERADGEWRQAIVDDPAFFFVHPHRRFDRVEFEIWFQNAGVPIVELGGLADVRGEEEIYDLQPLENLIIDQSPWPKLREDDLVLLQRRPVYKSIEDFFRSLPSTRQIASYHYSDPLSPQSLQSQTRLLWDTDLDRLGINYIIARYEPPERIGTWNVKRVSFDPTKLRPDGRTWKIVFSVPGVKELNTHFYVGNINATFTRPPFRWSELWSEIRERLPL